MLLLVSTLACFGPSYDGAMRADTIEAYEEFLAADPDSPYLHLLPPSDHARFWVVKGDASGWPRFIATILARLDPWDHGFLWPREGVWPDAGSSRNALVRDVMLRGAGIPANSAGAVRFERGETDALVAVLFAFVTFGWCGEDDLTFVPDHGQQLVQTDHHDVIHVQCRSEERMLEMTAKMLEKGYELPLEPPDWTFIRPAWMPPASEQAP